MTQKPLTPPDCDLRGLPFMPLDVMRLADSDLAALSTGDEFKAAILLWCKAWVQVPAASLPNNDQILARLAGLTTEKWAEVKHVSLRGFVICSDGRLYHPVIAEKAIEAWGERKRYRARRDADRKRLKEWRESKRSETPVKRVSEPLRNAGETDRTETGTGTGTGISPTEINSVGERAGARPKSKPVRIATDATLPTEPTEAMLEAAAARGFANGSTVAEFAKWRDYHIAKGTKIADADASFRTWLTNALEYRRQQSQRPARPNERPAIYPNPYRG